jgi:hypothetical protein|tara:strand:+ start:3655 stop:3918 length:264 start_codon:yes stop_codon:yes gene_type:complete
MTLGSREDFIAERKKTLTEYWRAFKSAPVKRGYNRLSGQQVPSKRDLTAACTSNLRELNNICETMGFKPIWKDPDDEDVELKGEAID